MQTRLHCCYFNLHSNKHLRALKSTYIIAKLNPLSAHPTKWSNTLKEFVGNLPTNCLSVFDHFVKLALKGLRTEARTYLITKHYQIYPSVEVVVKEKNAA